MKRRCACGSIQYELNDRFLIANHCHCSICQKAHGAAFGTFGHAKADAFRWLQGEALLSKVSWFDIADCLSQHPEVVDLRELVKG